MEREKKTFKCDTHGWFETLNWYENPVFLADSVADCPECGEKCWNPNNDNIT